MSVMKHDESGTTGVRAAPGVLLLGAALLAGCASGDGPSDGAPAASRTALRPVTWVAGQGRALLPEAVLARESLDDVVVGLAVQPDTGRRLALHAPGRLVDLDTGEALPPLDDPDPEGPGFGDMVGLGEGLLAVTGTNDGYLVHTSDGVLRQHFCFFPDWQEDPETVVFDPIQRALALGYDAARGRLYAQPRMFANCGAGGVMDSFLSSYASSDGADLTWWSMPSTNVEAGGMVVLDAGPSDLGHDAPTLLLGLGGRLAVFDGEHGELSIVAQLEALEVLEVTALAHDRATDTLLIGAREFSREASVLTVAMASLGL